MVQYNGQMLSVVCPPNVFPGQTLVVELNAPRGRSLFREAFDSSGSESKNSTETKDQGDGVVTWVDSRSSGSPYWDRTYTWSRIPSNKAEFRAAKQVLCRTPQGTACLLSMATLIYCNPRTTKFGEICLRLSMHPDVNFSRALRDFSSRMRSDPSIAASYVGGITLISLTFMNKTTLDRTQVHSRHTSRSSIRTSEYARL